MSEAQEKTVKLLDSKLDAAVIKTVTTCAIVMIVAVLIHDGDHIRQALNWGYSIPLSLWVLNLTVYVLPVVTLFLARSGRPSATLVGAVAGVFTTASFPLYFLIVPVVASKVKSREGAVTVMVNVAPVMVPQSQLVRSRRTMKLRTADSSSEPGSIIMLSP